jgi:hypothetical protein
VSDQLVQTTDDGNPRLSQWTGSKDAGQKDNNETKDTNETKDNNETKEEESCVVGMTIDEIYKNNA